MATGTEEHLTVNKTYKEENERKKSSFRMKFNLFFGFLLFWLNSRANVQQRGKRRTAQTLTHTQIHKLIINKQVVHSNLTQFMKRKEKNKTKQKIIYE